MERARERGRSLVPSAALTMPMYRGGKRPPCSASTLEKRLPSRRPASKRCSTPARAGLASFSSRASSASTTPRPADSNASSSWLNRTSDSLPPLPRGVRPRDTAALAPSARTSNCMAAGRSVADVGVFAAAARLAVAAQREDLEFALGTGRAVLEGVAPGIERHGLLQIRPVPLGTGRGGRRQQGGQALFRAGIAAHVEAEGVERFFKRLNLGLGDGHFRFAQLRKIFGADIGGQQADDDDHHQQFEQGKSGLAFAAAAWCSYCVHPTCSSIT